MAVSGVDQMRRALGPVSEELVAVPLGLWRLLVELNFIIKITKRTKICTRCNNNGLLVDWIGSWGGGNDGLNGLDRFDWRCWCHWLLLLLLLLLLSSWRRIGHAYKGPLIRMIGWITPDDFSHVSTPMRPRRFIVGPVWFGDQVQENQNRRQ